jgi:hypothetical protein
MQRQFLSSRLRAFTLICIAVYVAAAALSMMVAHILLVVQPQSRLAERIIAPVARGLEFLDTHWKSVLILVALPIIAPVTRGLVTRLRKAWGFEFDAAPVSLETEGVHEKPLQNLPGEIQ